MTRLLGVIAAALTLLLAPALAVGEERLSILAPWRAEGKVYKVGPTENQFIGTFKGVMYVETKSGHLDTALFVCPVTHVVNVETNATEASARCHIVAAGGNIYGRFQCTGQPGYCNGRFEITGGTDEFVGIKGQSDMRVRMALSAMMSEPVSGDVISQAEGLAVWPNLVYSIPDKAQ